MRSTRLANRQVQRRVWRQIFSLWFWLVHCPGSSFLLLFQVAHHSMTEMSSTETSVTILTITSISMAMSAPSSSTSATTDLLMRTMSSKPGTSVGSANNSLTGSEVMAVFPKSVRETVRDELRRHVASDPGEHADAHSGIPPPRCLLSQLSQQHQYQ